MKMTFKKLMPLILIIAFLFVGCSSGKSSDSPSDTGSTAAPEQSAPSGEKVKLTWWSMDTPSFVEANKKLLDAYQKLHPNVTIELQTFPYDVLIQKLKASYASNTPPDVAQMFGTWVWDYAKNGRLEPIDLGSVKDDLFEAPMGGYTYNNQVFGIPHEYNIENGGMLAWKKNFDEKGIAYPPKTWNDMIDAAKQLTVRDGDKIKVRGLDTTSSDSTNFFFLALILQQGGKYWTDDFHVNFNTPEAINAMTELKKMVTDYKVSDLSSFGNTEDEPYMKFFKNESAMTTSGPWTIAEGNTTFSATGFDYIPVPSFTSKPPVFAAESGWGEVISKTSKHKAEAADFLKFTIEPEQAKVFNLTTFTVPANKKVAEDSDFLSQVPLMKTSLDMLQYGQWIGPVIDRDFWWKTVNDHYQAICAGQTTVEEGLKEITDIINQMIDSHK
jgi:multiple sugar transport system substrate-binding protein